MSIRIVSRAAAATVVALAAAVGVSTPVQALFDPVSVVCPLGTITATYEPGINNTPRDILATVTTNYPTCVTALGDPVTSGTTFAQAVIEDFSCQSLTQGQVIRTGPSIVVVTWNSAETSTLTMSLARIEPGLGVAVITTTGSVTAGKFLGASVVRSYEFANIDLPAACATPEGFTSQSGPSTLTLTKLV